MEITRESYRNQARLMLEIVDRYLYDHMRDPQSLTPADKGRHAQIVIIQADLLQAAHGQMDDLIALAAEDVADVDEDATESEAELADELEEEAQAEEELEPQSDEGQTEQTDAAPKPKPRRLRK